MEKETFIPDDYDELLNQYRILKKELNEAKQHFYETSRQLKLKEVLLAESQSDNELFLSREQVQNAKFEAKVAGLEEMIATVRSNNSDNILCLETELKEKEKENNDLRSQLEMFKKINAIEATVDISTNITEIIALTNDNDVLQEKVQEMEEALENLRNTNRRLEETLEEYKEELSEVKESLKLKREELSENATLIDKLNDELICANRELQNYKHTRLEADSKGNSLFAEVDDRRVHLQETINQMKSSYIHLKQEHGQHVKLISQLRKENADLRESWKRDLEEMQEDKYWVDSTLKRHVEVLEELLEENKKQLEEHSDIAGSDLPQDFMFYHKMVTDKGKEIEQWKKKYSDKSVNEHLLSVNLAQANKKIRLLKLELQKQAEELKESKSDHETQKTRTDEVLCHKCKTDKENQRKSRLFKLDEIREAHRSQDRIPKKSCLKPQQPESDLTILFNNINVKEAGDKIFNSEDTPYSITHRRRVQPLDDDKTKAQISPNTTDLLISFEDKENINFNSINNSLDRQQYNIDLNIDVKKEPEESIDFNIDVKKEREESVVSNIDVKKERDESIDLHNDAARVAEKRGVTFTDNTVDPVGNPARRRATRVFIMKKKSDLGDTTS